MVLVLQLLFMQSLFVEAVHLYVECKVIQHGYLFAAVLALSY